MFILPSSVPQTKSAAPRVERKEDGDTAAANRARLEAQMAALQELVDMLKAAQESDDDAEIQAAVEAVDSADL